MESPYEVEPQLNQKQVFWKNLQAKCLQRFISVRWKTSESQWITQSCKFHLFTGVLWKALTTIKEDDLADMKRKQGEEQPERYLFVVDAVLRHQQFTIEEIKFLRKINLDGFVTKVSWKVLHEALCREALANFEESTLFAKVQGETIPIIAGDWRAQFEQVFHLTERKVPSTKQWELAELFPSLKSTTEGQETVKVSDCTFPGAKKPLKILSSLFCLNTAAQNYISIPFAELIVEALNGQAVDWPEEFYQGFHDEVVKLHRKSLRAVKVVRTTIGPHITLILKAAGVLNLRQEVEAGFYKDKEDHDELGKRRRCTDAPVPPPAEEETTPTPHSTVIETEQPWQVPEEVPNIVKQITQAHRRLENLLTSLSGKAPAKFMRQVGVRFHREQREELLRKEAIHAKDPSKPSHLQSQVIQLERMEQKLIDAQDLNDLYIESNFELEAQLSGKEVEIQRLLIVHNRDQDELSKLKNQEKAQIQRRENLEHQVRRLTEASAIQEENAVKLQHDREELTTLRAENAELRSALTEKHKVPTPHIDPKLEPLPKRPIDRTERQALATGAAQQLLNDLQQELQACKQEKEELQHQLHKDGPQGQTCMLQFPSHPNTEVYTRLLEHTEPLHTVMQYYQAYWAIDLLASNLPLPKRGITMNLMQFRELWEQASSRAKDTLAFMWTLSDIKLPLGTIEVVAGSPPFYIRRYILRSIAWLAQHQATQDKGHNVNQILPTLRPYNHHQKVEITKLQYKHETVFKQATDNLRREDTTICFEAVRRQQWLLEHHPEKQTNVTIPQLKEYVTQTLEEQQITTTKNRFGTINHGTILRIRTAQAPNSKANQIFEA